ncbi:MAG TPA: TraB/GumN family protein [Myxococcales bacterium]|nr:TraB/GumN family protein [Myxococcales bacterium]
MKKRKHASEAAWAPGASKRPGAGSRLEIPGFLFWLPILWVALQGCASLGNPQAVLQELNPRQTLPLAWQISGGTGAALYVLGSIHLGPEQGWEYPPGILEALEDSNALVVEVNVNEVPSETLQRLIGHYGHQPPGLSLRRTLTPATWTLLENRLTASGIPLRAANRLQPWLLSNLIIMDAIRKAEYFPDEGTEDEFIRRAGSRSIVPLESPTQQISFLGTLPRRTQELYLIDTLKHYNDSDHFVELYVDAWRSGDEKGLEKLIFDSYLQDEAFKPFFDSIIFDRNVRMGKQLKVFLDAGQHTGESVFVVLGVAHMIGNRGIAASLAAQGYRVHRLSRSELRRARKDGEPLVLHP